MTTTYRTSLAFARLSDDPLVIFGGKVGQKLTGNLAFPNPLVALPDLTGALTLFSNAIIAARQGGPQQTAAKNAQRLIVLGLLRQNAAYVQGLAGEDLAMLLSSGYEAINNNRAQVALTQPVVERVENPQSTKLSLRIQPVYTARAYEVRISHVAGVWEAAGVFTYSRPILIENLTPGTVYTLQARAVGGSTGYSDWSDPISHMAM